MWNNWLIISFLSVSLMDAITRLVEVSWWEDRAAGGIWVSDAKHASEFALFSVDALCFLCFLVSGKLPRHLSQLLQKDVCRATAVFCVSQQASNPPETLIRLRLQPQVTPPFSWPPMRRKFTMKVFNNSPWKFCNKLPLLWVSLGISKIPQKPVVGKFQS